MPVTDMENMENHLSKDGSMDKETAVSHSSGSSYQDKPARQRKRLPLVIGILAGVVVILALVLGLVFGLRARPNNASSGPFIPSSDYFGPGSKSAYGNVSELFLSNNNFKISSTPTVREYNWTISQMVAAVDGVPRQVLTVNGQYPGPLIEANKGDTIVVHVNNQMVNGTSIHWHGMFQNGTNWMDGTTGITQCAIPPNSQFTYNFTVTNQEGTYWWHSHTSTQYVDGILGPLIIHSVDEPHQDMYDGDLVVMLTDWYHDTAPALLTSYISSQSEGVEPVPDNGLVNGVNTFNCANAQGFTCSENTTLSSFVMQQNKRYRMRFINTGAFADFVVSIDEHPFQVIEADGTAINPIWVTELPIHVAQRYSIVIEMNQPNTKNYYIRANMNTNCFNVDNPALDPNIKAIISYAGSGLDPLLTPTSNEWSNDTIPPICQDLTLDMLQPYYAQVAPEPDIQYYIDVSFQAIQGDGIVRAYMNSTSWSPLSNTNTLQLASDLTSGNPSSSLNISAYPGSTPSNTSLTPYTASSILGPKLWNDNQFIISHQGRHVVEIIFNNLDEGSHPIHLHGHNFYVIKQDSGVFKPGITSYGNNTNPIRRDTEVMPSYGYSVIRFVTDNIGSFAAHCHLHWHMESGFLMQFVTLSESGTLPTIPKAVSDLCRA